jgi:hypothetical protein
MESKINRIIDIIRSLKEEGMVTGAPTNSLTSPSDGKGYIAGTTQAGHTPPVDLRKHSKWNPFFKDLAKMQRRNPQP